MCSWLEQPGIMETGFSNLVTSHPKLRHFPLAMCILKKKTGTLSYPSFIYFLNVLQSLQIIWNETGATNKAEALKIVSLWDRMCWLNLKTRKKKSSVKAFRVMGHFFSEIQQSWCFKCIHRTSQTANNCLLASAVTWHRLGQQRMQKHIDSVNT